MLDLIIKLDAELRIKTVQRVGEYAAMIEDNSYDIVHQVWHCCIKHKPKPTKQIRLIPNEEMVIIAVIDD